MVLFIFVILLYKYILEKEKNNLSVSLGYEDNVDTCFYKNIFSCKPIIFDIIALCFINIFDSLHVGFFPTILHEKFGVIYIFHKVKRRISWLNLWNTRY